MSKEFLDRFNNNRLTSSEEYDRMRATLAEMKRKDDADRGSDSDDWKNWELAPEWTGAERKADRPSLIEATSPAAADLHRALKVLNKARL